MQRRTFLTATASVAGALCAPAIVTAQTTTRLRLAHSGPERDSKHLAAVFFARQVEEKSGGALRIQVYPNSSLGNDNTIISATRGGTVDMVLTGNPYYTGLMPQMNVLDLPFLFKDVAHAYRVLDGDIGANLLHEFGKHQLTGLAFWEIGFRSLANSRRAIHSADDVRGLKIRTTPNPAHIQAFQLLGANPQPMPYAEVFPALEARALDGHENPPIEMLASKMYEVQKHLSMTRHAYTAMPLAMNKARFEKLPAEHQQLLRDEGKRAAQYQRDMNLREEPGILAQLAQHGIAVIAQPDRESFRAKVAEATRRTFTEKYGDAMLRAISA